MDNLTGNETQKTTIPWQERKSLGFLKAAWRTINYVLLKPGDFFANLKIEDSIKEPYLFYFSVALITSILCLAVGIFFNQGENLSDFLSGEIKALLFVPIGIFISSAILHLAVILLGGKGGFKGTLNVLAYNASSHIFLIVPFVGIIISGIWGMVVGVSGFKKVHAFSTIRATVAYFGVFLMVAIVALLAAIVIPNFQRARLVANENAARATVRAISSAVESYVVLSKGQFPLSEDDLGKEGYLPERYNGNLKHGYIYSVNLNQSGYEIVAAPSACGTTGKKIFMARADEDLTEQDCK